jgi:hypothetical protein
MNELQEARDAFAAAQSEAATADAEYAQAYQTLQQMRSKGNDPVAQLTQQAKLNQCLQRQQLARQMRDGHAAKLKACEKRAVAAERAAQVREYARLCDAITRQIALLMTISERLGEPFDAGIGGFRLPAYGLKGDDSGAYRSFGDLQPLMAEASKKLDMLLAPETADIT